MSTRIQDKSRTAKKVMGHGSATGVTIGKKPRADKKGYPATAGVPIPVLIGKAAVADAPTSPEPPPPASK